MIINTIVNNEIVSLKLPSGAVTLDVIREHLHLKGTKEGCREGDCGSCMILLGKPKKNGMVYRIVNSCLLPIIEVANAHVVTIEGLNSKELTPIQQYFVDEGATQCGFCTPGFIISITGYLLYSKYLNIDEAIAFLSGNICRCTGYKSIERAIKKLIEGLNNNFFEESYENERINYLVEQKIIPEYFLQIPEKLAQLPYSFNKDLISINENSVAGGTDVYVQKGYELEEKEINAFDINNELKKIFVTTDYCYVGSALTVTELTENEIINRLIPDIAKFSKLISCTSIRNRATIGGNIVNASPIGDVSIMLIALNAVLVIENKNTKREVPIANFFKAYKQFDLKRDEWLSYIKIPLSNENKFFHFEKVSKRTHLDIASVNTAISLKLENNIITDITLSAGGVAPVPFLLNETCNFLNGKELTSENIDKSIEISQSEIQPISDVRGSTEYKSLLLKQLIKAHFEVFMKNTGKENLAL